MIIQSESDGTMKDFAYDTSSNRTMNQYPVNNVCTGHEYNLANLVVTVDNYIGSDQPSYFYYTYTLDGNQIYKSTMDSGYDYSYDRIGRQIWKFLW